jgi:hypothetical protein
MQAIIGRPQQRLMVAEENKSPSEQFDVLRNNTWPSDVRFTSMGRRRTTDYSGVFRGGGGGATAPPLAWSMQEAVRDRPPPFGVIRGAMVGVWLGILFVVYGGKWKNVKSN